MEPENKYLPELMAEKDSLDPSFTHAMQLLTAGKRPPESFWVARPPGSMGGSGFVLLSSRPLGIKAVMNSPSRFLILIFRSLDCTFPSRPWVRGKAFRLQWRPERHLAISECKDVDG